MALDRNRTSSFPLGMYERPRNDGEWRTWSEAGINLVGCKGRDDLDEARKWGVSGWVTMPMVLAEGDDESALADKIDSLKDHPALAVWEAPDEAILAASPRSHPPPDHDRLDELVAGLERGSRIVRERDPSRKLWLNEGVISPVDTLARCAPFLDVVGFDYYPIPQRGWRAMQAMGPDTKRFADAAPGKEVWIVQQAFSWANLPNQADEMGSGYPTREEYRYMAWQAIMHGATGLLWWGSSYEDRPTPFMDDLMAVVAELRDVGKFLAAGSSPRVVVHNDPNLRAPILGCSCTARRIGEKTLFVLMNEDSHPAEAVVTPPDWLDLSDLRPVNDEPTPLVAANGGWRTNIDGYETPVYLAGQGSRRFEA